MSRWMRRGGLSTGALAGKGAPMTARRFLLLVGVICFAVLVGAPGAAPQAPAAANAPVSSAPRAVLDKYCVTCHNEKLHTAGRALDKMDLASVSDHAEVWEKVVRKLRTGAMPPPSRPRPDKTTYESTSSWLETELDHAGTAHPNPGRPTLHRLNRTE